MDTFRYYLALLLVCIFTPVIVYWPVIHGLIHFWRRVGLKLTNIVAFGGARLVGVALFLLRDSVLAVDFGTNWLLSAVGTVCFFAAICIRVLLNRDVTTTLLTGLAELEPGENPQPLVRTGLYAQVRNPRYVQMTLSLLGYALMANYLASYVLLWVWLPAIYIIVRLEERELLERYGVEYEAYILEVPRFLPKKG